MGLSLPVPGHDTPTMAGTTPTAIQAIPQAARSLVSAGSQPQKSQHDVEARTEMTVESAFVSAYVGGWVGVRRGHHSHTYQVLLLRCGEDSQLQHSHTFPVP